MFRKKMIKLGIRLISIFLVSKIKVVEFRDHVESLLNPLAEIAEVLTDKDPDDNGQMLKVWQDNKNNIIGGTLSTACIIIETKIKDPLVAQIICEMIKDQLKIESQK